MRFTISSDGPVYAVFEKIANFSILSVLWVVTSLPVITIGASTCALCRISIKMAKGESVYIVADFLKAFRSNFIKSTILFLIMAAFGFLLGLDLYFWLSVEGMTGAALTAVGIGISIPYAMTMLYVFAVQASFENTIKNVIKNSFLMSFRHFGYTLLLILLAAAFAAANSTILFVNIISLVFGIGLWGYLFAKVYVRVFANYIPPVMEEEVEEVEKEVEKVLEEINVNKS